jgi:crotonobetainyl-CoA:carnitine CoA-transferase CaiB-like acyl-CoA transferase
MAAQVPGKSREALSRVRVLDLSQARSGPTCARVLADFGADVIRIEPPPGPDGSEGMVGADREGSDFHNLNRNKRSLTLNLKSPQGRDLFMRLVRESDVVVENWRPDVKGRLGLDYASLSRANPRIIMASISGFGQEGPYASRPGFDQIIQGLSGLMSVTGFAGQGPVRTGFAVADIGAGLYAAIGVLVALHERSVSGQGQWVHTSLLHSLVAMMDFQCARYLNEGEVPQQGGNDHPTVSPMGTYAAAAGHLNIGVSGQAMWRRFACALGRPDWLDRAEFATDKLRVQNRQALNAEIGGVFATHPVSHWVEILNAAGVPSGPVYTVAQLFDDAHASGMGAVEEVRGARGTFRLLTQPVRLENTPATIRSAAPESGQHTEELLVELGLSPMDVRALREQGVV